MDNNAALVQAALDAGRAVVENDDPALVAELAAALEALDGRALEDTAIHAAFRKLITEEEETALRARVRLVVHAFLANPAMFDQVAQEAFGDMIKAFVRVEAATYLCSLTHPAASDAGSTGE